MMAVTQSFLFTGGGISADTDHVPHCWAACLAGPCEGHLVSIVPCPPWLRTWREWNDCVSTPVCCFSFASVDATDCGRNK